MSTYRRQQMRIILADIVSAELVWLLFLLFRWIVYEGRLFSVEEVLIPAFDFRRPLLLYPLGCLAVYYFSGYYLHPFRRSLSKEFLTTFISAVVISLGAFFIIVIDDPVKEYQRYLVSLGVLFTLQFCISYICRRVVGWFSRRYHVREDIIVIDPPAGDEAELYRQIRDAYPTGKPIYIRPRVYDLLTGAAQIRTLDGEALVCITDLNMTDSEVCFKRAFDIAASVVCLTMLSPLYLVLSALVWWSSKGPVFYIQERIGLHGHPFKIYKFRTMIESAEEGLPQLSHKDDNRITKIGHWMRKYRLDELPQLWNVLKGDMSFVGPRPERPYFINLIEQQAPYYCLLYKIRPGLTSWGPVRVGYTDTIEKMIRRLNYDITYMENMSLLLDLKIMLLTLSVLFNGKGQ